MVLLLALTSGATDAIGFLALGGAFTSVMTGNLVLLGVAGAGLDWVLALNVGSAIFGFIAGAAIGSRAAGTARPDDPVWPVAVTRALLIEVVIFMVCSVVWVVTGPAPPELLLGGLLMGNAMALGLQSSAVQRFGVPGLSTTYLTGTLTTVVVRLVSGHGMRAVGLSCALLMALVVGAAFGGAATRAAPLAAPIVQILPLVVALSAVALSQRRARARTLSSAGAEP